MSPLRDLVAPQQAANPADPVPEEGWEPPAGCLTGEDTGEPSAALADVVSAAHCWGFEEGVSTVGRQLGAEEVGILLDALESSRGHEAEWMPQCPGSGTDEDGNKPCSSPNVGILWLETADGGRVHVTEQSDGRLLWTDEAGSTWMYPGDVSLPNDDPQTRAAMDGLLYSSPATNLGFEPGVVDPGVCFGWSGQLEWSAKPLDAAVTGVLCDPTGATLAEAERELPADVVAVVAQAAAAELTPAHPRMNPSAWSLILSDADGAVFHLNQLSDGSLTYQEPDGTEWSWVPTDEALEALRSVGLDHLQG